MDEEFVKSVLGKAQDQYDSALRWTAIVVIVFLAFHLFIFSPFLKADKKLSKVEARLNSLPGIMRTVMGLSGDLTKLSDMAMEAASKRLGYMFNALRSDFDDLSTLVKRIRTGDEIKFSREKEEPKTAQPLEMQTTEQLDIDQLSFQQDIQESNIPNLMVQERSNLQMQQIPGEPLQLIRVVPPEQRFAFDQSLVKEVFNANNTDSLTRILLPTIEEKIIAPQFDALNQIWHTKILPEMKSRAEEIRQPLKVAEQTDTSEEAPWRSIRTALENTMQSAEDMNFAPPAERFWWITVTDKGGALAEIDIGVRQELDQTITIKAVTDDLAKSIAEQQSAEMKLKNELERIRISFDKFVEQRASQLAGLPQQLVGIPIDLISVVSRFPLLLGLVLAALLVWQTRRLSELITAVGIVREHDRSNPLAAWIMRRIEGNGKGHTKRLWYSIGLAVTTWLWIGISSWELAGWRVVDSAEAILLFLISGMAITAGFLYRWRTNERALASIK